jgi:hypothetical protein
VILEDNKQRNCHSCEQREKLFEVDNKILPDIGYCNLNPITLLDCHKSLQDMASSPHHRNKNRIHKIYNQDNQISRVLSMNDRNLDCSYLLSSLELLD